MKLHTFLAAAAVFSATALSAQSVQKLDEEKYSVTNGDVTLVVDAAHGAKILSFKLGEQEVIAQKPEPPAATDGAPAPRMRFVNPNSYGSTFWTSPQAEWNWPPVPEYDSKPYEAEATADAIVLTGQVSKYGYRVRKAISADPADGGFVITYTTH